jgi:hypothetical protein
VAKTCRDIIDDVEKLDGIQDGFIHFQLLRFCQSTRDCKIADVLLKRGTKHHGDGWDSSRKDWAQCVLRNTISSVSEVPVVVVS